MGRRILIGALMIGVLALVWWLDARILPRPVVSRALLWLLALGTVYEVLALTARKVEAAPGLFPGAAVALVVVVTPYLWLGRAVPGVLLVLAAALAGIFRLAAQAPVRSAPKVFPEAVALAASLGYAAGLACFLDRLALASVTTLFAVAAVAKSSDIFGYFVGTAVGRRHIVPAISPKKTWEGTIAGVLGPAGVAALLAPELAGPPLHAAGIGAAIGAASFLGGLISSGLKRWAGVKDSAALLPEFGGILDLMDSLLLAAPVAVIALYGS